MAQVSHDWETRDHCWDNEFRGEPDDDNDDDPCDSTPEQAGFELAQFLVHLCLTCSISAKTCCVLAFWAMRAGACGPIAQLEVSPDLPANQSGHYQRKFDNALKLRDRQKWLYKMNIPGHAKFSASREVVATSVLAVHELLNDEFRKDPALSDKLLEPHPIWKTPHFIAQEGASDVPLFPLALYLDGVVFQKRDSVLGFWMYNILSGCRHLFCVLKKSCLCRCGCRGWCSVYQVFFFLHWCLEALQHGTFPSNRHDGNEWLPSDAMRTATSGNAMLMRGILVQIKGDWAEFAHSLAFPTWSHKEFPCIFCISSLADLFLLPGLCPTYCPLTLTDDASYLAACASCEIMVTLGSVASIRALTSILSYDKRKKGSHGRALTHDVVVDGVSLLKHDRLEPSPALPDVGQLDGATPPIRVVFWRSSKQTRTTHRNPLFDLTLGISTACIAIDALHTLHLGVFKHFVQLVFWLLIDCNYCFDEATARMKTKEERYPMIVMRLRSDLWAFYDDYEKSVGHRVTRLTDLTIAMLGENAKRKLKTKGAETRWLMPFALHMLVRYANALGEQGRVLHSAGLAMERYWTTLEKAQARLTHSEIQVARTSKPTTKNQTNKPLSKSDLLIGLRVLALMFAPMRFCTTRRSDA
jgi:hypothetical protein